MRFVKLKVAFLIAGICFAQSTTPAVKEPEASSESTHRTNGRYNGRFWRFLDLDGKSAFLFGFCEAAALVTSYVEDRTLVKLIWPGNLTYNEVKESIDLLYDAPENRQIPISKVILVVSAKANGAKEEAVQNLLMDFRRGASK